MKLPQIGGCVCGAVRYEITYKPTRVYACHCTDCQRVTTSAFSIGVSVPGEAFRVTGKELQPVPGGVTEGGRAKTRWVCPDCGVWICGGVKVGTEPPDYTRHVRGGTLDEGEQLPASRRRSAPVEQQALASRKEDDAGAVGEVRFVVLDVLLVMRRTARAP